MIHCIAIDDEPLALEVIRKYASETPKLRIMETFTDAIQARVYLKVHQVDMIFLDIQMPDISGIQLFESLTIKPLVIFTTAFSEYAVKGFDLEAVDYLLKPIRFERFIKAVERAERVLEKPLPELSQEGDFIFVKSEYQSLRVSCRDVRYIEGLDDYVRIHLMNNPKPLLSLISLKNILEKLPPGQFMRVHRSFIVPIRLIQSVHNRMISLGNINIPVGETYFRMVQDWMAHH
jgi:two-component system, LytTR family, response regulator